MKQTFYYYLKCSECGEVTKKYYAESTHFTEEDFYKQMKSTLLIPRSTKCTHCNKMVDHTVVGYSTMFETEKPK